MGDKEFYGPGKLVDTKSKMTVVTQFIGSPLSEIKRYYVQNGKVIANSESKIEGVTGNSITTEYCDAQKKAFGDKTSFQDKGGMKSMSEAFEKGMVLVMSLWDDHYSNMLWLDSTYPTDSTSPGAARGSCETSSGVPADVESKEGAATVIYSNIKFGPINSTFTASGPTNSTFRYR
jgi:cellulose 1,4-beta-cellobiosidase